MKKLSLLMCAALMAATSASAVTFNVRVPAGTEKCYVCGAFNNWNVDQSPELSKSGTDMFTLTLDEVASVSGGFKYLCGRSWEYVEKDASGNEITDRTTLGNPDVVGSWYHVPDYSIDSEEITVNGIKRLLKVYLPEGYDEGSESYPVIYYNTVQQRFNNAGSDDAGDDFFAANSWNARTTMENLRQSGGKAYIMVQICSFLAENTPDPNDEFVGSGMAEEYLTAFVGELMPYIEGKYRVTRGAESTTIVGADLGGIFSVYAALMRPDVFGTCVSMSPLLWVNAGTLNALASRASAGSNFYLSVGSLEPEWMISDTRNLYDDLSSSDANVYFTQFDNAIHTDDAWGASFGTILSAVDDGTAAPAVVSAPRRVQASSEFENAVYTLYGGTNEQNLQPVGQLEYVADYYNGKAENAVPAMVITNIIPESNKSKYYWNIAKGADSGDGWLLDAAKNVSFSSKKNADSWHNIAVMEDGSTYNVAAHSKGFSVVTGNSDKIAMTSAGGFAMQATVSFPSTNKSFTIHYGSVNSASDMGALTKAYAVSDNCTEAEITYDFNLNRVSIKETGGGSSIPETEFKDRTYTLYAGETQGNLQKIGTLTYTEDYRPKGNDTPVAAFVITDDVPVAVKGTYYYNVAKGADSSDGWLSASDKTIGFSSKKTEVSWLGVAVLEDGSIASTAAHSKGFRVVTSGDPVTMTQGSDHLSTATVKFPGADKSFKIHFGSVNSASDMGSMTPQLSVSDDCIEAVITYDFTLNKVTVEETGFGQSLDDVSITSFTALPAVCEAGTPVEISITLSEPCAVGISCTKDFSTSVSVNAREISPVEYQLTLDNTSAGIYSFSVSLTRGTNTISNSAEINVRVLPEGSATDKKLLVNAYNGIDWNNIEQYKANFHTHTSQSFDTQYTTTQVVDRYKQAGYKILALTDHDANTYPWDKFSLYNPEAQDRDSEEMGILAVPGIELSKDRRNNWSESTGGEFNHHNDFFTGRKGQEFMSLRESYAYTDAIGGLQIINHPGQYWNLSTNYQAGEKNSPEWHAENFRLYKSLIGFEVYNQGNRRPNDRILWDQVLTINMPENPVWGYSCDDTHTSEQYFRNYDFMLMPELTTDALKNAMKNGQTVFSYEFTGSGEDKAPHINSISVDKDRKTITIDSPDADNIEWIYSTHRTNPSSPSSTKSTVVGIGKTFPFEDYQGSYVRARLTNKYGETATQPFGFGSDKMTTDNCITISPEGPAALDVKVESGSVTVNCTEPMTRISVFNVAGVMVRYLECDNLNNLTFSTSGLTTGIYVLVAATERAAYTAKFPVK